MICPECKIDKYVTTYPEGYWFCSECRSDGNIDDNNIEYRGYKMSQPKINLIINKHKA